MPAAHSLTAYPYLPRDAPMVEVAPSPAAVKRYT
jgi:hypothetical protein